MSQEVLRLIVADDDDRMRSVICEILESESDFEVVGQAKDVPSALALIAKLQPDLVVTDVWMPGGGGEAVCEGVKKFDSVPIVVAMSGSTWEGTKASVLAAGAAAFVLKDDAGTALTRVIRMVARDKFDDKDLSD